MASMPRQTTSQDSKFSKDQPASFCRVTFTVPPDIVETLDTSWRFHKNIDGTLCRNKSNYIVDLIRRDVLRSKS